MFDLRTVVTSGVTAVLVVLLMSMVGFSNQPGAGGDTRFPNSNLSASSLKSADGDLYVGETGGTACLVLQDSDDGGSTYVTALNGTLTATSTVSCL